MEDYMVYDSVPMNHLKWLSPLCKTAGPKERERQEATPY